MKDVAIWVIWAVSELLLLKIFATPAKMVFDRKRHYQEDEFKTAVLDFCLIVVVVILICLLSFIALK